MQGENPVANQGNIQEKLKLGIEAARRGDNNAAQVLLRQVVAAEPDNELGWMWLASVADTVAERRECLERALKINPNNTRAQEALRRLGGTTPAATTPRQKSVPTYEVEGGTRTSTIIIGAVLAVLVLAAIIFAVVYLAAPQVTATPTAVVLNPTATPTIDPDTYTATPFFGVIVTRDAQTTALPPTFTPTYTPPPAATLTPSVTPYPISAFTIVVNSIAPGASTAGLFQSLADGSGEQPLGDEVRDVVYDPSGERVAFVREVAASESAPPVEEEATQDADATDEPAVLVETATTVTELFIAPVNDLDAARQVTTLNGTVSSPTWAPNGIQLAFSFTAGGEAPEIWIITEDGNNLRQITDNDSIDRDPSWSPDGTRLAFASDLNSPGLTKVFTMSPDGTEITQIDRRAGSSYSPRWSHDGTHIVFVNDEGGDGDLYIMESDGENVFLLTPDDGGAEDRSPVFSPDDNWIAFVSNRDGAAFQTYLVDRRGNTPIRITNTERDDQAVDFRPELLLRLRQN
jgi:hypothetical protein